MQFERRTITQTVNIPTNTGRTVDEHTQAYLDRAATVMDSMGIGMWPAVVSEPRQDSDDVLLQILRDAAIPDAVENANGACFSGYVNVDESDIPDLLIAWRDAAIREALDAARNVTA